MNRAFSVFAFTLFSIGGAHAKDTDACGTNMICASDPQTVVDALQREGYRAKLNTDSIGDPMISSAATGYNFDIFFYGCEQKSSVTRYNSVSYLILTKRTRQNWPMNGMLETGSAKLPSMIKINFS